MREDEVIEKLKDVNFAFIKMESHQNWLRTILLNNDSFKEIRGVESEERTQEYQMKPFAELLGRFNQLRPVWKYSLGTALLLLVIYITVFSMPSLGPERANVIPEGGQKVIDGPALSTAKEEQVMGILTSDSRIQELMGNGAIIETIMPIVVTTKTMNPETGEIEEITNAETMAQVWLTKGEEQWGVVVDILQGTVVSISK
ncbi:hypothetical protein ACFLXY_11535 [Chloroflexota bacterium]